MKKTVIALMLSISIYSIAFAQNDLANDSTNTSSSPVKYKDGSRVVSAFNSHSTTNDYTNHPNKSYSNGNWGLIGLLGLFGLLGTFSKDDNVTEQK